MKLRTVGAELFHADRQAGRQADRQTAMMNLIVDFRKFAKTSKTNNSLTAEGTWLYKIIY
jgi:hypothetical protein